MTLITVIVPVYRPRKGHFQLSLASIARQSLPAHLYLVHIIFDGEHPDELVNMVHGTFKDKINYQITQTDGHLGLRRVLNLGLGESKTMFIARMDSDDIMLPQRLERQLAVMLNDSKIGVCGSNALRIDNCGNALKGPRIRRPLDDYLIRIYGAIYNNPISHPTAMARTDILRQLNGYICESPVEDYDLWSRVRDYKIVNISQSLMQYRIHQEQTTRNNNSGYWVHCRIRLQFFLSALLRYPRYSLLTCLLFPLVFIPRSFIAFAGFALGPVRFLR